MEPVYDRWGVRVFHGDNLDVLRAMPDCSVDSIVTDPPAGIGFLREWDSDRGGREQWVEWLRVRMAEALRVLKPGGHALVWAMPRTSHWTGLALEDAGFEVRDVIQHAFDNGMPKSLDVSKAIDKVGPRVGMLESFAAHYEQRRLSAGLTHGQVCEAGQFYAAVNHGGASVNWAKGNNVPTRQQWAILAPLLGLSNEWLPLIERVEFERAVVGQGHRVRRHSTVQVTGLSEGAYDITAPASDDARRWQGWGTGLRPAAEPWWLCRKPLEHRTVADSVVAHGTGAVNIDATRGPDKQWPANVVRFPKTPPSERPMVNGEQHPTVKSVALCRWLVRLVTPPAGTVLDLFAGTGSVGQAARAEGKCAILIEQDEQSIGFIRARLDARPKTQAGNGATQDDEPVDLLDLLGDAS